MSIKQIFIIHILIFSVSVLVHAEEKPRHVKTQEFDEMMKEVSNKGRWGSDDEMGTMNLIDKTCRVDAARLVTEGVSVSLALDLNTVLSELNTIPFKHRRFSDVWKGHEVAGDELVLSYHGFSHSHIDGLLHFAYKGEYYNGFKYQDMVSTNERNVPGEFTKLGIQNYHAGIVTRGLLVDIPWLYEKPYMEPGMAVTSKDLEAWEKKTGITIGKGDILLIRTGRWERFLKKGPWNFLAVAAGCHCELALWLKKRDVAALGSDGVNDVMPSNVEGMVNPLHTLLIAGMGMPLFDNLNLEDLSKTARNLQRWEFMFNCHPLRIVGGTGSPANPIAIF